MLNFLNTIIDLEWSSTNLYEMLIRFGFNLLVCWVVVHWSYKRRRENKEYSFTYMVFSIMIFFVCHVLTYIQMDMGFAIGLFAIFAILRYRTLTIPVREMTYLFVIIGISIINSLSTEVVSISEILAANALIAGFVIFLDQLSGKGRTASTPMMYERIELVHVSRKPELIEDLKKRTGLDVYEVDVLEVDFLRDSASCMVYYRL